MARHRLDFALESARRRRPRTASSIRGAISDEQSAKWPKARQDRMNPGSRWKEGTKTARKCMVSLFFATLICDLR
jgi:hypothetical protein